MVVPSVASRPRVDAILNNSLNTFHARAARTLPPVPGAEGALTALLYLFLIQLFWVLWRDLARAQRGATGGAIGLTVIEAPLELAQTTAEALDDPYVAYTVGQTFQLPSPATIGRAPGNTLSVPAETVSLSHL